ncbi:MAG: type II toxin-antitoxin system VapC family toxin [Candidatus Bathyarchaeota archaeon]|nr:type II toxin-antitoxin system VapC family toxin [Candidatus Bathyarchaeota archaeon]
MKYLFDASAIFKAIKENKIEALAGNYTIELARYELGNILWKEHTLHATLSEQEAKALAKTVNHTLSIMGIIETVGYEEEILQTAINQKITYYDASYAHIAKTKQLKFITEDTRLIKKITPTTNITSLDDVT